jgi:hypothetical protein
VGASRCGGTLPAVETEVTETPMAISVTYIDVDETISFTDDTSAVFPVHIDIAETITVSDATSAFR